MNTRRHQQSYWIEVSLYLIMVKTNIDQLHKNAELLQEIAKQVL